MVITGAGDDEILAGPGNDIVNGGPGNDFLPLAQGNDIGIGGSGDDFIIGGFGTDTLLGGTGNDGLFGGQNSDLLNARPGDDLLVGDIPNNASEDGLPPTVDPTPHFDTCIGAGGADQAFTRRTPLLLSAWCQPTTASGPKRLVGSGCVKPIPAVLCGRQEPRGTTVSSGRVWLGWPSNRYRYARPPS